jgi:cytidylate kinase
VQQQQETETELEQREADLRVRERRVMEREAKFDPEVAAKLEHEKEQAKKFDEFND